ncbi:hydroxyphenylglycine aminotransferase [Rhizobium sp. PP-F2F-G36]|nr:hydroxyphenylglycine aminotransferase [Rhizobium sp. PP-F2F-G36]
MTNHVLEVNPVLNDPAFDSMNFLNEIMREYPSAISFGPGAPNHAFRHEFSIPECLASFEEHLVERTGCTAEDASNLLYDYGPSKGILNGLIADALAMDEGIDVAPSSIVVTVGAQEAMALTLRALFRSPGDLLAVVTPCYVGVIGAAKALGVDTVPIAETEDGLDLAGLEGAVAHARSQGSNIRALYVAPDFANPSGTMMSRSAREQLLALACKQNFLIIEDTAYAFTAGVRDSTPSLKALDTERRVVQISTFSKIGSPALRVGFVIADQRTRNVDGKDEFLADALGRLKSMISVNTSPICQAVAGGMLLRHGGSIRALGRAKADFYRSNLQALIDALDRELTPLVAEWPAIVWTRPGGGFFVRLKVPLEVDLNLLKRSAGEYGVIWTPMVSFHPAGGGRNEIRLSCSFLTREQIQLGTERLASFLRAACVSAIKRTDP